MDLQDIFKFDLNKERRYRKLQKETCERVQAHHLEHTVQHVLGVEPGKAEAHYRKPGNKKTEREMREFSILSALSYSKIAGIPVMVRNAEESAGMFQHAGIITVDSNESDG